ncbi:hypothetical protein GIB67_013681 [Kingdonia uniflora]|uniref:DUF7148 domain-containing protein n=1 Tax=Kingdonia uniflora TaxID=39325 RepID=A0A7J7NPY7_9MAGN|nr:hypothetical protein GIB67_013681 [Kingdonia uniflora]
MATAAAGRQLIHPNCFTSHVPSSPRHFKCIAGRFLTSHQSSYKLTVEYTSPRNYTFVSKASSADTLRSDDDGVSLGTMKLPSNIDIPRFESLLFQVDKINGGARLGFITMIDDGKTEVLTFIDCLVSPATEASGPIFRAIRNGPKKDQPPPGEQRIMKGLLDALRKSVEIARV